MIGNSRPIRTALIAAVAAAAKSQNKRSNAMTTSDPITTARDHFFLLKVFVPSKVTCTDERIRWYFDHAIRGYHQQFALDTDPIRGMSGSFMTIDKIPLKEFNGQKAELEKLKAERDEAIFERDFYKTNLELADNHAKEVLRPEITRLTSQLDLYKAALEGISEVDDDGFTSDGHERCAERAAMALSQAASQWTKDHQAKGEGL